MRRWKIIQDAPSPSFLPPVSMVQGNSITLKKSVAVYWKQIQNDSGDLEGNMNFYRCKCSISYLKWNLLQVWTCGLKFSFVSEAQCFFFSLKPFLISVCDQFHTHPSGWPSVLLGFIRLIRTCASFHGSQALGGVDGIEASSHVLSPLHPEAWNTSQGRPGGRVWEGRQQLRSTSSLRDASTEQPF